jgi:hypothetical protein
MRDYAEARAVLLLRFTGRGAQSEIFDRISASVADSSESQLDKYSRLFEQYDAPILAPVEEALLSLIGTEWTPNNAGEYIDRLTRVCWRFATVVKYLGLEFPRDGDHIPIETVTEWLRTPQGMATA